MSSEVKSAANVAIGLLTMVENKQLVPVYRTVKQLADSGRVPECSIEAVGHLMQDFSTYVKRNSIRAIEMLEDGSLGLMEQAVELWQTVSELKIRPGKPATWFTGSTWRPEGIADSSRLLGIARDLFVLDADPAGIPPKYEKDKYDYGYRDFIYDLERLYAQTLLLLVSLGDVCVPSYISILTRPADRETTYRLKCGIINVLELLGESARPARSTVIHVLQEDAGRLSVYAADALAAIQDKDAIPCLAEVSEKRKLLHFLLSGNSKYAYSQETRAAALAALRKLQQAQTGCQSAHGVGKVRTDQPRPSARTEFVRFECPHCGKRLKAPRTSARQVSEMQSVRECGISRCGRRLRGQNRPEVAGVGEQVAALESSKVARTTES